MFDQFDPADLTPAQLASFDKIQAAYPEGQLIAKEGRPVYRWENSKQILEVDLTDSSAIVRMK